jgi:hypothetical protein
MRFQYSIALVILLLTNCKKEAATSFTNAKGILTGGPGCSTWIIHQDNGKLWQPLNIDSFQVTLKSGQAVIFSFSINNLANTCMLGETIELTSIRDR